MGAGLYHSNEGRTAYVEPFEGIEADPAEDLDLYQIEAEMARDDLDECIMKALSGRWWPVDRAWRADDRDCRIVARNTYHEVWTFHDDYNRVHVTFGVREHLAAYGEGTYEGMARATLDDRAKAFFDRLQKDFPDMRVRTSAWTSAPRVSVAA